MTAKLTDRPAVSETPNPHAGATGDRPGRLASWWGGWRIASRMARRDLRAHRVRSAIVVLMIALPVMVVIATSTAFQSMQVPIAKSPEAYLGSAQARLTYIGGRVESQSPDGSIAVPACGPVMRVDDPMQSASLGAVVHRTTDGWTSLPREEAGPTLDDNGCDYGARPVPGMPQSRNGSESDVQDSAKALGEWLGGTVAPVSTVHLDLGREDDFDSVPVWQADARADVFRGMVELRSGRWPTAPGEALLTQAGEKRGLPTSGLLPLAPTGAPPGVTSPAPSQYTIVGTAFVPKSRAEPPVAVVYPGGASWTGVVFLLQRAEPLTWSDVQRLGEYGIVTSSRAVLADPPHRAVDGIPGVETPDEIGATWLLTALMPTLAMLAVTCLIAGPAFAIIAASQRRMLALVAVNGAPAGQLRRTVVAEALWLGVLGAGSGVVGGLVTALNLVREGAQSGEYGPFDVPWLPVVGVVLCGLLAPLIAALVPTVGLGRLELAPELGSVDLVRRPPSRTGVRQTARGVVALLIGTVLFVIAAVTERATSNVSDGPGWPAGVVLGGGTLGLVFIIGGGIALVPAVLAALGRLGALLPLAPRLALRDASRLSGRATSTVAAIMVGSLLLALLGVLLTTGDRVSQERYRGTAPVGMMSLPISGYDSEAARAKADAEYPWLRSYGLGGLGVNAADESRAARELEAVPAKVRENADVVWASAIVPAGCAVESLPPGPSDNRQRCGAKGASVWPDGPWMSIVTVSPDDAGAIFLLDDAQQQLLRDGGAVVIGSLFESAIDPDGTLRLMRGLRKLDGSRTATWLEKREVTLAAVPGGERGFSDYVMRDAVLVTPDTAGRLGAAVTATFLVVGTESGEPLTTEEAEAYAQIVAPSTRVVVERGYQSSLANGLLALSIAVALISLIATVTATALAQGEARRDSATFAAVGARPGLRRGMAAAQAGVLGFVGAAMGLVVGGVPGAISALAISTAPDRLFVMGVEPTPMSAGEALASLGTGFVEVPWLLLLAALVAVPAVAAGFGWLFAGGRVDMTRRMD